MKVQQICTFFVLCLISVEGKNQVIQCYVCDDCDIFNDCLLEYCPPETEVTTSTTATSTVSTTPHPTWSPTPTSSTNPTPSPMPNTSAPTYPTASTSEKPTTAETTPTNSITTTDPPYHTTDVTTTTEVDQTASTGTETIFTSETEGTSDSGTSTPITGPPSTAPTSPPTSAQTQTSTQSQLTRNLTLTLPAVSYHCYSIDVVENYKQKKKRGCVEVPEEESACAVLRKEYGCSSKNCRVCSTDGCNCNGALRGSFIAVIAITLCGLFSKKI